MDMQDISNRIIDIQKEIKKIRCRMSCIDISFSPVNQKGFESNVEKVVTYGSSELWNTYSFYIRKVIYRIESVSNGLLSVLEEINHIPHHDGKCFIPFNYNYESVFFDFEDMIVSFSRLYEGEIIEDISRFLPRELKKLIDDNIPKRNDVNGLYWRINLLRNRVAHSTSGRYDNGNEVRRYMDFSSKVMMVCLDGNKIEARCTLIDLENNPFIKQIIQNKMIDGNDKKNNIFDILFSEKNPKGHGKKNPIVTFISNIEFFDYFSGFISLTNQMIDFINNQILVFMICGYSNCKNGVENQQWRFGDDIAISINDIYDINEKKWKK